MLEKIRLKILDLMKNEDAQIYLYGSFARGEGKQSSDIDIAVKYRGESNRNKIMKLREFFEESNFPYRVEIADMNFMSKILSDEIKRTGILWKA